MMTFEEIEAYRVAHRQSPLKERELNAEVAVACVRIRKALRETFEATDKQIELTQNRDLRQELMPSAALSFKMVEPSSQDASQQGKPDHVLFGVHFLGDPLKVQLNRVSNEEEARRTSDGTVVASGHDLDDYKGMVDSLTKALRT